MTAIEAIGTSDCVASPVAMAEAMVPQPRKPTLMPSLETCKAVSLVALMNDPCSEDGKDDFTVKRMDRNFVTFMVDDLGGGWGCDGL